MVVTAEKVTIGEILTGPLLNISVAGVAKWSYCEKVIRFPAGNPEGLKIKSALAGPLARQKANPIKLKKISIRFTATPL